MRDTSDLRAWYREDIAQALRAIRAASFSLDEQSRKIFDLALVAACYSFGIEPKLIGIAEE